MRLAIKNGHIDSIGDSSEESVNDDFRVVEVEDTFSSHGDWLDMPKRNAHKSKPIT